MSTLVSRATEYALAAEALQQKALSLEARSESMASDNQDLQKRLDAALVEMEVGKLIQLRLTRASEEYMFRAVS